MAVAVRRRRHGDGLPPGLTEPGGRRTSAENILPFQRLATAPNCLIICSMCGVWYSQNFTQTPGVEGIDRGVWPGSWRSMQSICPRTKQMTVRIKS